MVEQSQSPSFAFRSEELYALLLKRLDVFGLTDIVIPLDLSELTDHIVTVHVGLSTRGC